MIESTLTPDRRAAHPGIKRPETRPRPATLLSMKIHAQHLERLAIVYVRQSSTRQVEENIESTQMQYQLVDRATALGWPRNRVLLAALHSVRLTGRQKPLRSSAQNPRP